MGNQPIRLGSFTSRLLLRQIPSEVCGVEYGVTRHHKPQWASVFADEKASSLFMLYNVLKEIKHRMSCCVDSQFAQCKL